MSILIDMDLKDDDLIPWILDKMNRNDWWYKKKPKHTDINNIPKGSPQHLRGKIREVTERLIKDGLVVPYPTGYGYHVCLNYQRIDEILSIIEKWKIKFKS